MFNKHRFSKHLLHSALNLAVQTRGVFVGQDGQAIDFSVVAHKRAKPTEVAPLTCLVKSEVRRDLNGK